jgi:hypothetical protein
MVDVYSVDQLKEVVGIFKRNSMRPKDDIQLEPVTWYRGQSNFNYQLVPSLYRLKLGNSEAYREFESNAITHFVDKCKSLNISMEERSWDVFYSMQHYGAKTRALDWSTNALIGLFFAFEKWNPKVGDASLYLLDPIALNFIVKMERELMVAKESELFNYKKYLEAKDAGTIAVEPSITEGQESQVVNKRIIQQDGKFTLHETKWPLEAEIDIRLASTQTHIQANNIKSENVLLKVNLKNEMYEEVKHHLKTKGIDHTYVYPDIEGVANYVNRGSLPNEDWFMY